MKFLNPLRPAVLIKRYKRFLADVQLPNGDVITIHCPNTGAMTGCARPGMKVWISDSGNPKRKYRYTWELAETTEGDMICVNTQRANQIAGELLQQGMLEPFTELTAEQKYGYDNRRIDWQGIDANGNLTFIEVKSVTLAVQQQGYFPDTVSERARQHLASLQTMASEGHRAMVLYVVLHSAIRQVSAAEHIDAKYAEACIMAKQAGVEFNAIQCQISAEEIKPSAMICVK
ncbi:DNA/RNA nuclease SfsA [Pseudidiomarina donghaiensis]|uniref:Sugar fermentation stimulation protein homolog n=1 Tax=Pseudidiomarina donghaiensis TaxID=519452 RepID=A0A432XF82_9GAMM|nr:DNA/RNA nuclease SfsA [Pseudidiomarina donghaiensis]RUO47411.1 DNA/RNA nuclease SfsA [Pseudidiomarina donghaiensis]SFV22995.1 sugar fermentation stimulation protein A [Pseudidiomarina donghaiensis]